jgi:hypothetical protein
VCTRSCTCGRATRWSPLKCLWNSSMCAASWRKSISSRTRTLNSRTTLVSARTWWFGNRTLSRSSRRNEMSRSSRDERFDVGRSTFTATVRSPSGRGAPGRGWRPRRAPLELANTSPTGRPSSASRRGRSASNGRAAPGPAACRSPRGTARQDVGPRAEHLRQLDEGGPECRDRGRQPLARCACCAGVRAAGDRRESSAGDRAGTPGRTGSERPMMTKPRRQRFMARRARRRPAAPPSPAGVGRLEPSAVHRSARHPA